MQYKLINDSEYILLISDGGIVSTIPNDPANSDWQAYQQWLTELDGQGNPNQPLPAEQ